MSEERLARIEAKMDQLSDVVNVTLKAAVRKLGALRRGHKGVVNTREATSSHGVPRQPKPPDLCQGGHHLFHECYEPSPALRGRGKAFTHPLFNGGTGRTFVSWLYSVECYFEDMNISEEKKLELVVSCLKGDALLWYKTLAFSRRMEGKGRIRSWFKLEMKMRLRYLPCSIMDKLWVELKTLKQNSLSVIEYAKFFEELHFVCDPEVSSVQSRIRFFLGLKTEIAKRIKVGMVHSYGELLELALDIEESLARPKNQEVLAKGSSLEAIETVGKEKEMLKSEAQGKLPKHLDSLEPKSIEVLSYGEEEVSHDLLPILEEGQADLNMFQVSGVEQKNDGAVQGLFLSTYMSPLDLYINKRLQKPLSLKMDQFLTSLDDKRCWSSTKNEQGKCSYLVTYLGAPNLILCISHCPRFRTSCLGGITCALSTPHFHFYMLMRLQTSLVHSSAISYILRMNIDGISCSISKMTCFDNVNLFEEFKDFKYHSWVLFVLLSRVSISEMFILIHSRWKLVFDIEMDQFKSYCQALKLLYFEVNIVQVHCKNLLEILGISRGSPIHDLEGALAFLGMFVLKLMHKNSCSPLIALLCSTGCLQSDHGLSMGAYMLLVIQCAIIEVKLGVEPPWPFGEGYTDSMERETEMGTNRGNEGAHASSSNVQFSILVAGLLSVVPMSPKQAIMVFDPGGRHMISVHGITIALLNKQGVRKIFFSFQNLRSNSFEPGEVAAGAKGRGLSFLKPVEQSMEQLQKTCQN